MENKKGLCYDGTKCTKNRDICDMACPPMTKKEAPASSSMRFDVKCVRDCLVNNGRVFTVRSWAGYAQESIVKVDGVGTCKKVRITKVASKDDIARYVKLSGFASVDEWWAKVCSFGAQKGFLFLVMRV